MIHVYVTSGMQKRKCFIKKKKSDASIKNVFLNTITVFVLSMKFNQFVFFSFRDHQGL